MQADRDLMDPVPSSRGTGPEDADVDRLVDKLLRKLFRQLAVDGERRGWQRWP